MNYRHFALSLVAVLGLLFSTNSANAINVFFIDGPGNNTLINTNYGTATAPLNFFDSTLWFTDSNHPQSNPLGRAPLDGDTVIFPNSCCNPEPFVSIDNGGAGVNLPTSSITFDNNKTNLFDLSAGDLSDVNGGSYNFALVDDGIIVDTIAFNGGGGAPQDVFVPVTANTFTSNRHGARIFMPFDVNEILARSGHQEKWEFHASPVDTIGFVELNENRGPDGGNIDGNPGFQIFADMDVTTLDHIWMRLQVEAGATLTVEEYNYSDYTNKSSNNAINPLELEGELNVTTFNILIRDDANGIANQFELAPGTYTANDLTFLTGAGTLNVGGPSVPEPTTAMLSLLALGGLAIRRRKRQLHA